MPAAITAIDQCVQGVDSRLFTSLVRQESNFNPYAIGLDGKAVLKAQPKTFEEAAKTADNLAREGKGFSVGLGQVHVSNVVRFGLTWEQAFDPCTNLRVASHILRGFHSQAVKAGYTSDGAIFAALRGYNSGSVHNRVSDGYARDILGRIGYASPASLAASLAQATVVANGPSEEASPQETERVDPSSPSMFSTASPSMFGEDAEPVAAVAQVSRPALRAAHAPATDDLRPVVLRAAFTQ